MALFGKHNHGEFIKKQKRCRSKRRFNYIVMFKIRTSNIVRGSNFRVDATLFDCFCSTVYQRKCFSWSQSNTVFHTQFRTVSYAWKFAQRLRNCLAFQSDSSEVRTSLGNLGKPPRRKPPRRSLQEGTVELKNYVKMIAIIACVCCTHFIYTWHSKHSRRFGSSHFSWEHFLNCFKPFEHFRTLSNI